MAGANSSIRRTEIIARLLAAIPANYALTSLATACLARLLWQGLGVDAANASVTATLLSFAVFAIVALTAFGMRSVARIWIGMIVAALVMGGALWLSLMAGGRL